GCRDDLPMEPKAVVPVHAGFDEMAIGYNLHGRPWPVIVIPAQIANEFLANAVAPESKLVRLDRMHAKLDPLPHPAPFRPGVTQQAITQQAKVDRPVNWQLDVHPF